jgi:hypothetical protein
MPRPDEDRWEFRFSDVARLLWRGRSLALSHNPLFSTGAAGRAAQQTGAFDPNPKGDWRT